MNVSLEVKELGGLLEKHPVKWTFTLSTLVVIWGASFAAGCFLVLLIMVINEFDETLTLAGYYQMSGLKDLS